MTTPKFKHGINYAHAMRVCIDIEHFFNVLCDPRCYDTRTELENLEYSLILLYCSLRDEEEIDSKIKDLKRRIKRLPQKGEYKDSDDETLGGLVWLLFALSADDFKIRVHYHGDELCSINCNGFQFNIPEDVGKYLGIEDTYSTYIVDSDKIAEDLDMLTIRISNQMKDNGLYNNSLILDTAQEIIDDCRKLLPTLNPNSWYWVLIDNLMSSMIAFRNVAEKEEKIPYDLFYDEDLREGITAYRRWRVDNGQPR